MSGIIQSANIKNLTLKEKLQPHLGITKIKFALSDQSQIQGNLTEIGEDYIVILLGPEVERMILLSSIIWLQLLD